MKKIWEIIKKVLVIIAAIIIGLYAFFDVFFTSVEEANENPDYEEYIQSQIP